MSSGVQDN